MKKPSLAIAYNIKKHAQKKMNCGGAVKMAAGGEVAEPMFSHKDLAHAVMKKLSDGGIVEGASDEFLTGDEDTELPNIGMPDDTDERMEAMANGVEDDSHKGILHGIMNKIHKHQKG
jgi:hypothetical protein